MLKTFVFHQGTENLDRCMVSHILLVHFVNRGFQHAADVIGGGAVRTVINTGGEIGVIHCHTPLAVGPLCGTVCGADTPHAPVVVIKDTVLIEDIKVKSTVVDEGIHV